MPLVVAVVDGRPIAADPRTRCRSRSCATLFTQVGQQLTAQGITGRHQPRVRRRARAEGEEEVVDPRYAAGAGRARRR